MSVLYYIIIEFSTERAKIKRKKKVLAFYLLANESPNAVPYCLLCEIIRMPSVSHSCNYSLIGRNWKLCSNKGPGLKRKACLQFVRPKGLTCNGGGEARFNHFKFIDGFSSRRRRESRLAWAVFDYGGAEIPARSFRRGFRVDVGKKGRGDEIDFQVCRF